MRSSTSCAKRRSTESADGGGDSTPVRGPAKANGHAAGVDGEGGGPRDQAASPEEKSGGNGSPECTVANPSASRSNSCNDSISFSMSRSLERMNWHLFLASLSIAGVHFAKTPKDEALTTGNELWGGSTVSDGGVGCPTSSALAVWGLTPERPASNSRSNRHSSIRCTGFGPCCSVATSTPERGCRRWDSDSMTRVWFRIFVGL